MTDPFVAAADIGPDPWFGQAGGENTPTSGIGAN